MFAVVLTNTSSTNIVDLINSWRYKNLGFHELSLSAVLLFFRMTVSQVVVNQKKKNKIKQKKILKLRSVLSASEQNA